MKQRQKQNDASVALPECEWNFAEVSDVELVACCYWEYARESAFIRKTVQNLQDVEAGKGSRISLDAANRKLTLLYSIGTPAHLVHHQKFPKPWQSLPEPERARLGNTFKPEIPAPEKIPAFRVTSNYSTASWLFEEAKKVHDAQRKMVQRLSEIDTGMAGLREANELRKQLDAPLPSLIVRGVGGVDFFIAQVNWQDFTDNEIVIKFKHWVANNRPMAADTKQLVGRRNDKGHKLNDWRVMLDRLAIMRLLHHATLKEMPKKYPKAWERYGERKAVTKKQKDYGGVDWYRESKNAKCDFHRLFPFLKSKLPSSWHTKGGRR